MKKGFNNLSFMALINEDNETFTNKPLPEIVEGSTLNDQDRLEILEFIFSNDLDSFDGGTITFGGSSFDIINTSIEQGSLFLWLWSDSLDEEKILRVDITAGFVESDPTDEDSNDEE